MPKFRFELEAVLKARLAAERQKQLALARLEQERVQIEDYIRLCQQQIRAETQDLRDHLTSERRVHEERWGEALPENAGVDMRAVKLQANAALQQVGEAQRAVLQLAGVHKRIDRARLDLLEATTARKAVEALKERRFEAWREAQKKSEAAMLDEISVMRARERNEEAA
jgi:flagellar export protein FliJ